MRTPIFLEENAFQYRTILSMFVKKGEINGNLEIHLTFKEENELSSIGYTFFINYKQGSKLRNIQDEYKLSDEEIISFVFKKTMVYINKCIKENNIIDIHSFIDEAINLLSFECREGRQYEK